MNDLLRIILKAEASKNILAGRRVNLSKKLTKKLHYKFIEKGRLNFMDLLLDSIFGNSRDIEKGLRIGYKPFRGILNKSKKRSAWLQLFVI